MQLDDIDRQLLDLLCENGRSTFSELGRQVHLSTAAVKRRVDRLHQCGVIRGYSAIIDSHTLGWAIDALCEIRFRGTSPPTDALRALDSNAAVVSAFTVAGDADVVVRLRVKDTHALQQAINDLRTQPDIVATKTTVVLNVLIDRPATREVATQ